MNTHKYELVIWWSDDDAAFVVDVPELPGCMAHGARLDEAVANSQTAIDFWLEGARETGRPIPRPRGRRSMPA
jgi:predicted RNase H-like HicB family nuclease